MFLDTLVVSQQISFFIIIIIRLLLNLFSSVHTHMIAISTMISNYYYFIFKIKITLSINANMLKYNQ